MLIEGICLTSEVPVTGQSLKAGGSGEMLIVIDSSRDRGIAAPIPVILLKEN